MKPQVYIDALVKLYRDAYKKSIATNDTTAPFRKSSRVLLVIPHPDDEVMIGSIAFKLKTKLQAHVDVFPATFGSKISEEARRRRELDQSLKLLRFNRALNVLLPEVLASQKFDIVISPHERDMHPTHLKVYAQTLEAMNAKAHENQFWIQTGYWGDPASPNFAWSIDQDSAVMLLEALMKHEGEISRNPFHVSLPARWMDQVRLASELVQPVGSQTLPWIFGQMGNLLQYKGGKWVSQTPLCWGG